MKKKLVFTVFLLLTLSMASTMMVFAKSKGLNNVEIFSNHDGYFEYIPKDVTPSYYKWEYGYPNQDGSVSDWIEFRDWRNDPAIASINFGKDMMTIDGEIAQLEILREQLRNNVVGNGNNYDYEYHLY